VFALTQHEDVAKGDLRVSVWFSSSPAVHDSSFLSRAKEIDRDARYRNRLIHRYTDDDRGTFLIAVTFQEMRAHFFHIVKGKVAQAKLRLPAPDPSPKDVTSNPFESRAAQFIRIQEQYEEAKERVVKRKLSPIVETAALDELEGMYQVEVERLQEKSENGSGRAK
jgi:hypothetical protein